LGWAQYAVVPRVVREKLTSTNVGRRERDTQEIFMSLSVPFTEALLAELNGIVSSPEGSETQYAHGATLRYDINPSWKAFASYGRNFRLPSFTELYYRDAANRGNSALEPEHAALLECGTRYYLGNAAIGATVFQQKDSRVIDWTRVSTSQPWDATNIGTKRTRGVEANFDLDFSEHPLLKRLSIWYSYMYANNESLDLLRKYSLSYTRHDCGVRTALEAWGLSHGITLRYKQPNNAGHYFLLDATVTKVIHRANFTHEVYAQVDNLLNVSYQEISGIPMPGRWLRIGYKIKF
jgi:iron complex outermembrane receptor protein